MAFSIRPFTAACVAPVLLLGVASPSEHTGRWSLRPALAALTIISPFMLLFLLSNCAFTGSAFLSPYAVYRGTGLPPEISLNPATLLAHLPVVTRWSLQATLFWGCVGVVPAAAHAVLRERERRPEVLLLGGIFLALVLGHVLQTENSSSLVGERYYFEAYWAVAIVGARGWYRLARRSSAGAAGVGAACALLLSVQLVHVALYSARLADASAAGRAFTAAVAAVTRPDAVVFLQQPVRRERNYNVARWRDASRFSMEDPGSGRRDQFVRALGKRSWVLVRFDSVSGRVTAEPSK